MTVSKLEELEINIKVIPQDIVELCLIISN